MIKTMIKNKLNTTTRITTISATLTKTSMTRTTTSMTTTTRGRKLSGYSSPGPVDLS